VSDNEQSAFPPSTRSLWRR